MAKSWQFMNSQVDQLETLRRQIDAIDDAIHDLLIQRSALMDDVAGAKPAGTRIPRPAREAEILRRLAARHHGGLSLSVVLRIWREIIAGFSRMQGPFAVAVCVPAKDRWMWDLARDHYGSTTPITPVTNARHAMRMVIEGSATVAVLPWPDDRAENPWWHALMAEDAKVPSVVARLPFAVPARGDDLRALAVAVVPHQPTGDDHSLVAIELFETISRSRLKAALDEAALPSVAFWSRAGHRGDDGPLHLVEIADFVERNDPRLATLTESLGDAGRRALTVGGFAMPIQLDPSDPAVADRQAS